MDRLAEIEQRARAHFDAAAGTTQTFDTDGDRWFSVANWGDKPHRLVYDLAGDNRSLVAALRAVLDLHQQSAVYPIVCHCGFPWPCVEYRAITEALGGGA